MVSQLVDQTTHNWKTGLINENFEHDSAVAILSIHLPPTPRPDKLMWLLNSKGRLSVKSAFQIASNLTQLNPNLMFLGRRFGSLKFLKGLKC